MDDLNDESVAWPSYVDFLSAFVFVLFIFIGSVLYLQTGDVEWAEFLRATEPVRNGLTHAGIENHVRGRMVIIPLKKQIEFPSGQSELRPEHLRFLRRVGNMFTDAGNCRRIVVAGYADASPVRGDPFGNWRLSSARAQSVLEFFHGCSDCGYGPDIKRKLILSGEGDTGAGRDGSVDRRVDIIIDYTDASGR